MAVCRSCNAKIVWRENANGRQQPFDTDGKPHHETCPQANAWRKEYAAKKRQQQKPKNDTPAPGTLPIEGLLLDTGALDYEE